MSRSLPREARGGGAKNKAPAAGGGARRLLSLVLAAAAAVLALPRGGGRRQRGLAAPPLLLLLLPAASSFLFAEAAKPGSASGHGRGEGDEAYDVARVMASILGTMVAFLAVLVQLQSRNQLPGPAPEDAADGGGEGKAGGRARTKKKQDEGTVSLKARALRAPCSEARWLPDPASEPSKRAYEAFVARYTPAWVAAFGGVVATRAYESFTAWGYLLFTGLLALPLLLQPAVWPSAGAGSPDARRPLLQRYSFKANLWIAVYSFIGNYWYTHYFYSVLGARYTMPSHRLNNVPVAMFLATHFYFSSYHLLSNAILRQITTRYRPGRMRAALFASAVLVLSYFTAFAETLSISSYPYYSFRDRNMAYTVGSAFYGIYFLVSFPAFFFFDSGVDGGPAAAPPPATAWATVVDACGNGMLILLLLDFVRLWLDVPLVVGRDPAAAFGAAPEL